MKRAREREEGERRGRDEERGGRGERGRKGEKCVTCIFPNCIFPKRGNKLSLIDYHRELSLSVSQVFLYFIVADH